MNRSNGDGPETVFKAGGVRASVWKYTNTARNGQAFTQRKVVLERSYRDREGNWKNTNSFDANDVPKALLALWKAYEYMHVAGNGGEQPAAAEEYIQ